MLSQMWMWPVKEKKSLFQRFGSGRFWCRLCITASDCHNFIRAIPPIKLEACHRKTPLSCIFFLTKQTPRALEAATKQPPSERQTSAKKNSSDLWIPLHPSSPPLPAAPRKRSLLDEGPRKKKKPWKKKKKILGKNIEAVSLNVREHDLSSRPPLQSFPLIHPTL